MSEEAIGEAPEALEVSKRPRKTLIAISLIVLVALASVSVFVWWYSQKGQEALPTPSPEFNMYSKYGFSFEYPEGMPISEHGILESTATDGSGFISGELSNGKQEFVRVGWVTMVQFDLELGPLFDVYLEDMEADLGVDVDKGQLVTSTKSGHEMTYLCFTAATEGKTYGVLGGWYCDTNDRFYDLTFMSSEQDVLSKFQQYLDSFVCHAHAHTEEPIEKPFIIEAPSVTEGWNLIAQYSSEEYTQYDNVTYPSSTGDIPYREITLNLHITYDTFNVKFKVVTNGAWKIIHRYYWDSRFYGGTSFGSLSQQPPLHTRYLYNNDQVTPSQDITLTLAFSESIESWAITIEGK